MSSSTIFMHPEYTSPAQFIALPSLPTPASSPSSSSSTDSDSSSSEHIKRPCNAFMIYRSSFLRAKEIPAEETNQQQTLSRIIGQAWRAMTDDKKAIYKDAAAAAAREHRTRYPNYKFSPGAGKPKAKAKTEKKIGKVSVEEVTRMRMQYTNVKGPVLSSPRGAKKTRSVKANARPPPITVDESAFAPVPEAVPSTTGFADSVLHAPLRLPSGPQYAPQAAEAMQYGAQACNFNTNDYLPGLDHYVPQAAEAMQYGTGVYNTTNYIQPVFNTSQYAANPTFIHEAHYNNTMWNPTSAFQPALPMMPPMPFCPVQQPAPIFSEQSLCELQNPFVLCSSSVIPSSTNPYDYGTIVASLDDTAPFVDCFTENLAGLSHNNTVNTFE